VSIWVTIAATASPTALSSSGISSTICIVGHPPSLGLLLPLRCHGSAPGSTALLSGSPRRAASPAQDRSHTLYDGRYRTRHPLAGAAPLMAVFDMGNRNLPLVQALRYSVRRAALIADPAINSLDQLRLSHAVPVQHEIIVGDEFPVC